MDNQAKVEAFKSFYKQAKEAYAGGDIPAARELFLKAAQLANDISVTSTSIDVKEEYHKAAKKLISFVQNECSNKPKKVVENSRGGDGGDEKDKPKAFQAQPKSDVTFKDVAGLKQVKDQIKYKVLEPLRNPELASMYKISAGAKLLLYGPPGTGKTFIARAIAGEVDAAFYAINCQDLISKYMGDSSKRLDELFDEAQSHDRAIIFFDEFDAVASKRSDGSDGADGEMARFVATFLTKVDGFKRSEKGKMLLLIAATNRPWVIDSAMLRGGRFDTHIYVGMPDQEAREFMVNKGLGGVPIDSDVDLKKIAEEMKGFGGGDIGAMCEKIRMRAYTKSTELNKTVPISLDDCMQVIKNTHNHVTQEEIDKYESFYKNGRID